MKADDVMATPLRVKLAPGLPFPPRGGWAGGPLAPARTRDKLESKWLRSADLGRRLGRRSCRLKSAAANRRAIHQLGFFGGFVDLTLLQLASNGNPAHQASGHAAPTHVDRR